MVREILVAVERAADESDLPFLRHTSARAPHGLLGAEEVYVRRGTTKSDAGRRRVALDDRAVGALVSWQTSQQSERDAACAAYDESGRVVTMEDGRA
jgi:hypothetical protein